MNSAVLEAEVRAAMDPKGVADFQGFTSSDLQEKGGKKNEKRKWKK